MELDVASLAERSGSSVDTIRYYQSRGLLHPPEKRGRNAVYSKSHLERLHKIQGLAARGFSLKAIAAVLDGTSEETSDRILLSAIRGDAPESKYTADELAEELDIPKTLLAAVDRSGLLGDEPDADGRKFSEADRGMAKGAVRLLRYGFPMTGLLRLAIQHDRAVRKTVDSAIDLFDEHVRKAAGDDGDGEAVADAFRDILPVVTALIAHHFQRVLVHRALNRLRKSGEKKALNAAVQATTKTRFGIRWS